MTKRRRAAALDAALADMFQMLQKRPLPAHLRSAVRQLEEADRELRPSPSPPSPPAP